GAVSAWNRSLEIHPDNPEILKFMDEAKAAAATQKAAPPAPVGPGRAEGGAAPAPAAPTAEQEYQTGASLYAAGKSDEAWAHAAEALRLDPKHWQAWQLVGNCQYAKGDKPGALVSYKYSLQLHP